jgi:hypothetical protein
MMRNNKFAILLAGAGLCAAMAAPSRAQVHTAPTIKAKPLHTKKPKMPTEVFEVLHMTLTTIQVRSVARPREIHTFTYADSIRAKMQKLFDRGGYQYGDIVRIEYQPGAEIALKIKGKPSKPL